jgi:hypothetical protein
MMKKFKIDVYGYGGELTVGRLTEDQVNDINDFEGESFNDAIFNDEILDKPWSEIDDACHQFTACDSFMITIKNEDDEVLYRIESDASVANMLDVIHIDDEDCPVEIEFQNHYKEIDEPCLVCFSCEKGTFFEAELELEEDFDISKLKVIILEDCGLGGCYTIDRMLGGILYDEQELQNIGSCDTDGKYFDVEVNF